MKSNNKSTRKQEDILVVYMKKLVVYYSFEGNVKIIGDAIAEEIGADVLELKLLKEPQKKEYMKYYLGEKQVLMKTTPLLQPYEIDLTEYDLIIFGTPIWSGTFAPALRTFFADHEIKEKIIGLYYSFTVKAGLISEYLRKELKENTILNEIGFKDPLEHNLEREKERAKKWAKNLIENIP